MMYLGRLAREQRLAFEASENDSKNNKNKNKKTPKDKKKKKKKKESKASEVTVMTEDSEVVTKPQVSEIPLAIALEDKIKDLEISSPQNSKQIVADDDDDDDFGDFVAYT